MSHGCREPSQGQAKGVGGSSLIKTRIQSWFGSFQPPGIQPEGAEASGGELLTPNQPKANPLVRFRVGMLCLGAGMVQQAGLHKAQQLQSAARGRGTACGQAKAGCQGCLEGML